LTNTLLPLFPVISRNRSDFINFYVMQI